MKANLVADAKGNVFATFDEGKTATLVFTRESVHPDFFNLLRTAVLLYQTSQHTAVLIDNLVSMAETANADILVPPLLNANASTVVVREAAVKGIETIIARTIKNDGSTH
jgi:hypothetical protein